jgi:alpha-glucosidase (family GH31 glycosyl hydrolase)
MRPPGRGDQQRVASSFVSHNAMFPVHAKWRMPSRVVVTLAAAGLILLLVLAACTSRPAPTSTPTIQPAEAERPSPTPESELPGSSHGVASPTPEPQPQIDVAGARMVLHASDAPDPFLQSLTVWDEGGSQIRVTETLSVTIVDSDESQVRTARWAMASDGESGRLLTVLAEQVTKGVLSVVVTATRPAEVAAVGVCLPAQPDEHFYGLGERFEHFDLTGQVVRNQTAEEAGLRTTYAPSTFLLSSLGYGLQLQTMGHATFDLRIAESGCYTVQEAGTAMSLYLFAGPTPREVVQRHAQWIGLPPLPPQWSFGVWKNLIGGQERVLEDLAELRQAGVPLDAVWIYDAVVEEDGFGWPWQIYGPIPPGDYPDLSTLIGELHSQDLKVLGYLNPFVYPSWGWYSEASQNRYLVQTSGGQPYLQEWTFGSRAYVDFTSTKATRWWQEHVSHALAQVGFDGAMLDFGEDAPHDGVYAGTRSGHQMDNMYPLLYHKAAFEAGEAVKPGDFVFFARAGYSGSQPYTTGRFTGDQVRSWSHRVGLSSVIPAVLNGSLSGWPYWGPDIAGFFQGKRALDDPDEKELWIRWLQLGALMPTMRDMYGAMDGDPVDLWSDDETLDLFRTYAELHTALKPYLYRYAKIAHAEGLPIVRPLFLNHPDDAETYVLEDEYLLGDDLLVAPVLEPGQRERSVYLPAGRWRHYWTGDLHEGPDRVTVPAPLHQVPLFLLDGSNMDVPPPDDLKP